MSGLFNPLMALLLFLTSAVQADVLLEKISRPGFVMPSYAVSRNCVIKDTGELVFEYQLDTMVSKRSQLLQLSKINVRQKINEAATGKITAENFPVDANSVLYRAFKRKADGTLKTVLLYEENGGSGQKRTNNSESAIALRNFIDLNCGDPLLFN